MRGAGFPASQVLALASAEAARLADRILDGEGEAEAARRRAITACTEAAGRMDAQNALKKLRGRKLPARIDGELEAIAEYRRALEITAERRRELEAAMTELNRSTGELFRRLARDPRFREAVSWQNRGAVRRIDAAFAVHPAGDTDSGTRKQERLIASYLQRYCTKNDTIGFFGPVGWARLVDAPFTAQVRPGRQLLARRRVYFEHWCVDALAQHFAVDLRPDLAPWRMPTVRIEGTTLHYPIEKRAELEPPFARVLALCDRETSARRIAELVLSDDSLGFDSADEVFDVLDQLVNKGLVVWTIPIPTQDPFPEVVLRRRLQALPESAARAQALSALDELETCRAEVAKAAGDAERVDGALGALEACFTRITGSSATRRQGETYAGRMLVYEDCVRDCQIELGREILERIGAPLDLLLLSARWLTSELARRYHAMFRETFRELSTGGAVDYLRFWAKINPHLPGATHVGAPPIAAEIAAELQARWTRIFAVAEGELRVERSVESLRAAVEEAFDAPGPGWPAARYQPPDLLIAAESLRHLEAGNYRVILGELHHAMTNMATPMFLKEHPAPEEMIAAREADLPSPGIAPIESREHATRSDYCSVSRHDFHVEMGATPSWRPQGQVLEAAQLIVEERDGRIEVATRDGRHRFDAVAFFEPHLTVAANLAHFSVAPSQDHVPRVQIGELVIQRESWRVDPATLDFAKSEDPVERFVGARRWARTLRLPRFVFVKIPEETKPFYLDFDSPVFVEIFAKLVRKASAVAVSEMLPSLAEAWLPDADGERYTCELRAAVVDPTVWEPR